MLPVEAYIERHLLNFSISKNLTMNVGAQELFHITSGNLYRWRVTLFIELSNL